MSQQQHRVDHTYFQPHSHHTALLENSESSKDRLHAPELVPQGCHLRPQCHHFPLLLSASVCCQLLRACTAAWEEQERAGSPAARLARRPARAAVHTGEGDPGNWLEPSTATVALLRSSSSGRPARGALDNVSESPALLHQMPVFGFGCIFWSI